MSTFEDHPLFRAHDDVARKNKEEDEKNQRRLELLQNHKHKILPVVQRLEEVARAYNGVSQERSLHLHSPEVDLETFSDIGLLFDVVLFSRDKKLLQRKKEIWDGSLLTLIKQKFSATQAPKEDFLYSAEPRDFHPCLTIACLNEGMILTSNRPVMDVHYEIDWEKIKVQGVKGLCPEIFELYEGIFPYNVTEPVSSEEKIFEEIIRSAFDKSSLQDTVLPYSNQFDEILGTWMSGVLPKADMQRLGVLLNARSTPGSSSYGHNGP